MQNFGVNCEFKTEENQNLAAILDSQSVKTTETPGVRGYNAA
jgi:hypothetical protein